MVRRLFIIGSFIFCQFSSFAQHSSIEAYEQLIKLTQFFHGTAPYSCHSIIEVKYQKNTKPILDTSMLIYKNGSTYYKSKLAEQVEGSEGEIVVNHELKTVSFYISDSLKEVFMKKLNFKQDTSLESMFDKDDNGKELQFFKKFILEECNMVWETKEGVEEISFIPKNPVQAILLSLKIAFKDSKIQYYEFANRDIYAKDLYGKSRFRIVRKLLYNFKYDNVQEIPSKVTDYIELDGWTVRLKKYTNYQLSVL